MDGQSSIAAGPVVDQQRVGQGIAPGHSRMAPAVLAGPCIPHGLSLAVPPVLAEGQALVPRAPASELGQVLVLPGQEEPVALVV